MFPPVVSESICRIQVFSEPKPSDDHVKIAKKKRKEKDNCYVSASMSAR